jgi:peptidyl-dipeptidase Dcp
MENTTVFDELTIRTDLRPGDLEQVIQLHKIIYGQEYQYGSSFHDYVSKGLDEFRKQYDPNIDRVWVCEHNDRMVGFLSLMHRPDRFAQLRYFVMLPAYRGKGLGKYLMDCFMQFLEEANYQGAYLWTSHEQIEAASLYLKYGFKLVEEKDSTTFGKSLKEHRYLYLR